MDYLLKKFTLKCTTHEAWSKDKVDILAKRDYEGATLVQLEALAQRQSAFDADLGAHQSRVEKIVAIAEELKLVFQLLQISSSSSSSSSALQYHDVDTVNKRTQDIVAEWDRLGELSTIRKDEIDVCFILFIFIPISLETIKCFKEN